MLRNLLRLAVVGAAAGLAILAGNAAGASTALATYSYSYESSFQGWVAKTDQNTGTPECGAHNSSIARSSARAYSGAYSVDFRAHGAEDCGLLWLDRRFYVGTTAPVTLDLSFWLYTEDLPVGTGGQNQVLARGGATCVTDPTQGEEGGWTGFTNIGSTGHDEGAGWYNYRYQATVTPSASGYVCVSQAFQISSTYDSIKHYYLDSTTVTLT